MDFRERCKNARAFIVLLAAMITLLLNIKYDRELLESLIILIIVIAVFYVIATIAVCLIDRICRMEKKQSLPEVSIDDTDTADGGNNKQ